MHEKNPLDYEGSMLSFENVMDLLEGALQNKQPLSLVRYGHMEVAYLGWSYFPEWTILLEPFCAYSGATGSVSTIRDQLREALVATDIVGFHTSWGGAWEDRETAKLTGELLRHLEFSPKNVCWAYISHEMTKSDRFWAVLTDRKVALVGRRAEEARKIFAEKGVQITQAIALEGYEDIDRVHNLLCEQEDWDIVLISAGIPAKILTPRLARQTNKVAIDFGHGLDKLIDQENFDYKQILKKWKEGADKRMLVSVVMAVYNGEMFLREAVDSALAQTYPDLEIIIVNDGSSDSTRAILDEIKDERVRVIHLEENQGAANALNIGIQHANGEWIAIHDADDNAYPTKIEEQVKYIKEHTHLVGVGTMVECIRGCPDISDNRLAGLAYNKNIDITRQEIRAKIFWGCPVTHSSMMFSKEVFWEVGGYDPHFKIAYDHDLWLKLLEKGEIEKIPQVLLQYRIYNSSLSSRDSMATVNEIQVASSKGIYRRLNKTEQPKVIVIGTKSACKNYSRHISPLCGLKVYELIYDQWRKQIPRAVKDLQQGKVDAIILLDSDRKEKDFGRLKDLGLKLDQELFNIYNILN